MPSTVVSLDDLPEPPGVPLVGHLPALAAGAPMHRVLDAWRDEYGATYRIRMARTSVVVTSSPAVVNAVLRERPEQFRRGHMMSDLISELGADGLFNAEGAEWRRLRRMAMRGLNAGYLRNAFGTITRSTDRLRDRWAAVATGQRVDVLDDLMSYSLEVVVGLAMGHDLDAVRRRDEEGLHRQLPKLLEVLTRRMNLPVPYWRWVRLPGDRRMDATVAELGALIRERYAEARSRVAAGAEPGTYVESLAHASLNGHEDFTEEVAVGTVLNMLVAGEDTTAATAAWALHYLSINPEVQQKVRAEAAQVLGDVGQPYDHAALARLTYAEAVVNEVIRLRPVTPFLLFEPMTDTTVTEGVTELRLTRGTPVIVMLTYGSDSDADRYPDPGEFRPERWLDDTADPSADAQPFLPFGSGPRFCPGRNLALLETLLIVTMACRNFTIEPHPSAGPVGERLTFAVLPTRLGVRLRPAP